VSAGTSSGRDARLRNWPPLVAAGLAVLAILAILPSSLNLPSTAPAETLEFSPVPPEDSDTPPPPGGNFSSLGLGGSGAFGQGSVTTLPELLDAEITGARGKNPSTKRCVGNPPRQSEDPLSPPCVAFYDGNNGGATYQGVAEAEVRVLFYVNCCITYLGGTRGREATPSNTYVDLAAPPQDNDHAFVRALRFYQRHFNERYQTYGRFIHFYVYFKGSEAGPEPRRAEAIDNYQKIKPFAVLTYVSDNAEAYLDVMQRRGVMAFGGNSGDTGVFLGRSADYYRKNPGLVWGYLASLEQYAAMYTSLVCSKIVPHPVSFSGNGDAGRPRRLGLLWSNDKNFPFLKTMKDIVRRDVEKCGGKFVAEATFPVGGFATGSSDNVSAGTQAIAHFVEQGVTTVLWPGGMEVNISNQAAGANYRPEWVVLGDGLHDTNEHGELMDQSVWEHAWVVTPNTLKGTDEEEPCFQAAREGDPTADRRDITSFACTFYNDTRQLFTGIQVAGPKLTPGSMDRGFHAIPRKESSSVRVPACYYDANDFTCVKDAQVEWWDPVGRGEGCWRSARGGRRFVAGGWPEGDLGAFKAASDPCNQF
jgi:hypothetical protein